MGTTEIPYRQQYHYDEIGNITSIDSWNSGRAQPGTYEEDYVGYWFDSGWHFGEVSGASGGSLASANSTGGAVRLAFNGAGLNYVRMVGPDQGIARLFLDGALLAEVDNYTASSTQQAVASFAIGGGDHLLEVRVSGEKNPLSTGSSVSLDAIEVLETGPNSNPDSHAFGHKHTDFDIYAFGDTQSNADTIPYCDSRFTGHRRRWPGDQPHRQRPDRDPRSHFQQSGGHRTASVCGGVRHIGGANFGRAGRQVHAPCPRGAQ